MCNDVMPELLSSRIRNGDIAKLQNAFSSSEFCAKKHGTCLSVCLLFTFLICAPEAAAAERLQSTSVPQWFFLPVGNSPCFELRNLTPDQVIPGHTPKLLQENLPSDKEHETPVWHSAAFPHQGFDRLQSGRNVYGWYACVFTIPSAFRGRDLSLDLGVIDDADMTYVNGTLVGRKGRLQSQGSAWNKDRRYRIPADTLRSGQNIIFVHVYDKWGLGGIVGPPFLSAPIISSRKKWQVLELGHVFDGKAEKSAAGDAAESLPELTQLNEMKKWNISADIAWQNAEIPDHHWDRRYKHDGAVAAYRAHFVVSEDLMRSARSRTWPGPILDIGPVHDAAAVFLNGARIGRIGRFPDAQGMFFAQTARRGRIFLPSDLLRKEDNELVVLVYDHKLRGGLPGIPGLVWTLPALNAKFPHTQFESALNLACCCHQSGRHQRRDGVLKQLSRLSKTSAETARLTSARLFFACRDLLKDSRELTDRDRAITEALKDFRTLALEHGEDTMSQDALQAAALLLSGARRNDDLLNRVRKVLPHFNRRAGYIGRDSDTRGNWVLSYGTDGYVLAAMAQIGDWQSSPEPLEYSLTIPGGKDLPRNWLAARNTADPRALLKHGSYRHAWGHAEPPLAGDLLKPLLPGVPVRRAAWWDDHGEQHAFDEQGPDLLVHITVPPGLHRLSFYLLDSDWSKTWHPRQQGMVLFDEHDNIQDVVFTGTFGNGLYERFAVKGPSRLKARFYKLRSACVAVSGVFLDKLPASDQLLKAAESGGDEAWTEPVRALADRFRKHPFEVLCGDNSENVLEKLCATEFSPAAAEALAHLSRLCAGTRSAAETYLDYAGRLEPAARSQLGRVMIDKNAPLRWSYGAYAPLFAAIDELPEEQQKTHLQTILKLCTAADYYPLRQWALRKWTAGGFPETSTTRHVKAAMAAFLAETN